MKWVGKKEIKKLRKLERKNRSVRREKIENLAESERERIRKEEG